MCTYCTCILVVSVTLNALLNVLNALLNALLNVLNALLNALNALNALWLNLWVPCTKQMPSNKIMKCQSSL